MEGDGHHDEMGKNDADRGERDEDDEKRNEEDCGSSECFRYAAFLAARSIFSPRWRFRVERRRNEGRDEERDDGRDDGRDSGPYEARDEYDEYSAADLLRLEVRFAWTRTKRWTKRKTERWTERLKKRASELVESARTAFVSLKRKVAKAAGRDGSVFVRFDDGEEDVLPQAPWCTGFRVPDHVPADGVRQQYFEGLGATYGLLVGSRYGRLGFDGRPGADLLFRPDLERI